MPIFLKILAFLIANPAVITQAIKTAQALFGHLPGEERFAVVAAVIREGVNESDPDDKAWEIALRFARPFINKLVADTKGRIIEAAAGAGG